MVILGTAAAILSFLLTPPLTILLRKLAVIDGPNERSSHVVATPRGAGLTLIASVLVCMVVVPAAGVLMTSSLSTTVLAFGCLYGALGFCDDVMTLGTKPRLGIQFALAAIAIVLLAWGSSESVGRMALTSVICIFGIVAFVNAFNFMDGINGISGIHGALGAAYFSWQAWSSNDLALAAVAAALAGASLGFLPFNFPRAKIFLGDVGSYFLGATLALLAVSLWLGGTGILTAVAPLLLYVADTGWTLAKRAQAGKSLTQAHREHAYQRLAARFGHAQSAAFSAGCSLAILAIVSASRETHPAQYLLCAAVVAFYIAASELLGGATVSGPKP